VQGVHRFVIGTGNALERQSLIVAASQLAVRWPRMGASRKRIILTQLIARIDIKSDAIEVQIHPQEIPNILNEENAPSTGEIAEDNHSRKDTGTDTSNDAEQDTLTISLPVKLKRAGLETKLVIDADYNGSDNSLSLKAPDPYLHKLIAKAHEFQVIFLRGGKSITAMAEEAGVSGSYFTRTLKYSFLAPDITKAIIAGRQPVQLTARKLRLHTSMPTCWNVQRRLLEFI